MGILPGQRDQGRRGVLGDRGLARRGQDPAAGAVGNLRRDTLTGPGFTDLDLSLAKSTTIHEHVRAQFRAEFFNVLNHTNLLTPNPVVYSSGPQQSSNAATLTQAAVLSPTAGVVTAAATSRQLQFGLKLLF